MCDTTAAPRGVILHAPRRYDAQVWLFTLGRERRLRRMILDRARIAPGEAVLDVGCGTGSLALEARRRAGIGGSVHGIDASPEMIGRATQKARNAGLVAEFRQAAAQTLPYADACFDLVLSTLMLHHLPHAEREQCAREMRRVLKPGGRVLAVDFDAPSSASRSLLKHFHPHSHVAPDDLVALIRDAGLRVIESGPLGFRNLQFVLAERAIVPVAP